MTDHKPELLVFPDIESASQEAAERFTRASREAVTERGSFFAAIPGGSSPKLIFEELAGERMQGRVPWSETHIFFTDERCVPPDSNESNYRQANELLLGRVPIPEENIHRLRGEIDPDDAARQYEVEMRRVMGDEARLDFVLLGMGEDTHTASLFPDSPALFECGRLAAVNPVEKLGTSRLTLTTSALNRAREVVILAFGRSKADGLREVMKGEFNPRAHPVQAIIPDSGSITWIVDAEAASKL